MRVIYWWPGRRFRKKNPIPEEFLRKAKRRGTRYLTVAYEEVNGRKVYGVAFCCPKDNPSRRMGKRIAIGRLRSALSEQRVRSRFPNYVQAVSGD
jgi:hypothetical protein